MRKSKEANNIYMRQWRKNQRAIKREANFRAAGLIEAGMDTFELVENIMRCGLSEEDAMRVIEEMQRIIQRLRGENG